MAPTNFNSNDEISGVWVSAIHQPSILIHRQLRYWQNIQTIVSFLRKTNH